MMDTKLTQGKGIMQEKLLNDLFFSAIIYNNL